MAVQYITLVSTLPTHIMKHRWMQCSYVIKMQCSYVKLPMPLLCLTDWLTDTQILRGKQDYTVHRHNNPLGILTLQTPTHTAFHTVATFLSNTEWVCTCLYSQKVIPILNLRMSHAKLIISRSYVRDSLGSHKNKLFQCWMLMTEILKDQEMQSKSL